MASAEMRELSLPHDQNDGPSAHQYSGQRYSGWMNKFCTEPTGDAGTCCLGYWIPCVLYGRIDERLRRLDKGEHNPEPGSGCNSSCLIWFASMGGFCGGMTANRRTRLRGLYGITGTLADDCVKSFFCNTCVLMQEDREIRAREGQLTLKNSDRYRVAGPVDEEPQANQPMRYISPREFEPNPQANDRNSGQHYPQNSEKYHHPGNSGNPTHRGTSITPGGADDIRILIQSPRETERELKNRRQTLLKLRKDNNKMELSNAPVLLATGGQENESSGTPRASGEAEPGRSEQSPRPSLKNGKGFRALLSSSVHDLADCFKFDTSKKDSNKQVPEDSPSGYALVDCCNTELESRSNKPATQEHMLADCERAEDDLPASGVERSSNHSLTDCDTIVIGDEEPSGVVHSTTHELSYVHDFTDCPVDKNVLEYYEKEEKQALAHALEECLSSSSNSTVVPDTREDQFSELTRPSSPVDRASARAEQHELDDCHEPGPEISNARMEIDQHELDDCTPATSPIQHTSSNVNEHGLNDCHRAKSATVIVPEDPPFYGLPDCCASSVDVSSESRQHKLSDCRRRSSVIVGLMEEIEQHGLVDCTRLGSVGTVVENSWEEGPDCCQNENQVNIAEVIQPTQHRMSNCHRASSSSAAVYEPIQQHTMDDCTRSSSLNVLPTKAIAQHDLNNCSRLSSTARLHLNDPCMAQERGSNGSNSVLVSEQNDKSDIIAKDMKGHNDTDTPIASRTVEISTPTVPVKPGFKVYNSKIRKSKSKKLSTKSARDGKGPQLSRSREHSAEHALASILANSEASSKHGSKRNSTLEPPGSSGDQQADKVRGGKETQSQSGEAELFGKMTGLAVNNETQK